jgi:hypothetical protein
MYQLEPTSRIINRQQFSHSTGSRLGINQLQHLISILFGFSSFVSPPASLISNTQTPKQYQLCYSIQQLECQQQQAAHIQRHSANNSSRNQAASNNMAMQLHNTVADNMGMRPGDNCWQPRVRKCAQASHISITIHHWRVLMCGNVITRWEKHCLVTIHQLPSCTFILPPIYVSLLSPPNLRSSSTAHSKAAVEKPWKHGNGK